MNFIISKFPSILLFAIISGISSGIYAIEVIRAELASQGSTYQIDIGLYDDDVQATVANFHSYLDDGSFNNLLINRSVPGFVIQGGAFTFDDTFGDGSFSYDVGNNFNGGLQPVTSKGTVNNEFKHSNIRGTLAMAKIDGDPDSATNEWFINLTDNTFLDDDNGGFTVFGEVLHGMTDIDSISSAPVHNLSNEFTSDEFFSSNNFAEIPLHDYTTIEAITKDDLLIINNFTPLFQVTNVVDFADATVASTKDIIIKNNNIVPLELGIIDTTPVLPPFSIANNFCDGLILTENDQCIITIEFTPPANTADYFLNEFNINVVTASDSYDIPVTVKVPSPRISVEPVEIDYGFVPIYNPDDGLPEFAVVRIKNNGDKDLNITSINFETATPSEFVFFDNCTTDNNDYKPGFVRIKSFCLLVMHFKPVDLGIKSAEITITSNDPVNNVIKVPVAYGATTDTDGISSDIEAAAPNNGDGNNDDSPDHLQNNVVSFNYLNSPYITLVTDKQIEFTKTTSIDPANLAILPDGITLGYGVFSFELTNIPVGGLTEFGIILQQGESPSDLYMHGPNINDTSEHWYKLVKDTTPGVEIIGNAAIQSPSGVSINRNFTIVSIVDGGFGDADMTANGTIVFVGGPEISKQSSSSSGALLWMLFLVPFLVVIYRNS